MLLKVLVVLAALSACSLGDEDHDTVDSNFDLEHPDEWITAVFGDYCQECTEPIDEEIEIIEEEPQYEVPVDSLPEEIVETTHEHHPNRPPRHSSLRVCRYLVEALKELEASHPHIQVLKKELKQKLHKHLSYLVEDLKRSKGDSVCKILDFVISLARSLKANCSHKGTTPAPHTEKPVPEYPGYPQQPKPVYPVPDYEPQPEYPVPDYEPQPEYPESLPEHSTPDYEPQPGYPEHPTPDYEPHPEHEPEHPVPDYEPHPQEPIEYPEEHVEVVEEIELGSHISPPFIGSVRGIPGEHYPNYTEVPITGFSCADKKYIPGFYADLETGCQVFHVCYEHRRESFLCPLGTIFNQPILACDYWYSSNCSQASLYYDVNAQPEPEEHKEEVVSTIGALITTVIEGETPALPPQLPEIDDLSSIVKFLPVKAKVTIFKPVGVVDSKAANKIVSAAAFPVVKPLVLKPKLKPLPLAKAVAKAKFVKSVVVAKAVAGATVPVAKMAVKAAAVPVVKAKFVKAAAVPVVKAKFLKTAAVPVKAKFLKVAAAVPVVKSKLVVAPVAAAKVVGAKAVPVVKFKVMGAVAAKAVPVVKTKLLAVPAVAAAKAVPAFKFAAAKAIPIGKFAATAALKTKLAAASVAIPLVKAKFAAAAISPLTKKALALGYMKLLKAKKIAIMG